MQFLREIRNAFFLELGKKRFTRIVVCTLVIATVWNFADTLSGSLAFNLWHDLICLCLGILAERLLPWNKTTSGAEEKLQKQNAQLKSAMVDATNALEDIADNYMLVKKQQT